MWAGKLRTRVDALKASGEPEENALGVNLTYDHRVTAGRMRELEQLDNDPSTSPERTKVLLRNYHWNRTKRTTAPDFANSSLNGANVAVNLDARTSSGRSLVGPLSEAVSLHRVLDVSNGPILDLLTEAARRLNQASSPVNQYAPLPAEDREKQSKFLQLLFDAVPRRGTTRLSDYEEFLRIHLQNTDDGKYLAKLLQYTLWQMSQESPFECIWISRNCPDPQSTGKALCEWAGFRATAGHVVVELSYQLRYVRCLFRPCQLDAGIECLHFPSPIERELRLGGCVMDLSNASGLASEYVHCNVHIPFSKLNVSNIQTVSATSAVDLQPTRRRHYDKLCVAHAGTKNWLPSLELP